MPCVPLAAPELDAAEERSSGRWLRATPDRRASRDRAPRLPRRCAAPRSPGCMRESDRLRWRCKSLSAAHAVIDETRALEAAAAERRARALAQRLARFDVQDDGEVLLLTPRERWFETGSGAGAARAAGDRRGRPAAWRAARAGGGGAGLRHASGTARCRHRAVVQGRRPPVSCQPTTVNQTSRRKSAIDRDDLGCARADVVRAFLISHGVDPRRIVATLRRAAGRAAGVDGAGGRASGRRDRHRDPARGRQSPGRRRSGRTIDPGSVAP